MRKEYNTTFTCGGCGANQIVNSDNYGKDEDGVYIALWCEECGWLERHSVEEE